jgi:uncharacterized protein (TIGR03437 family)
MISTTGVINTIAGNGRFADTGDTGPATSASLNSPAGVTVDGSGNVYVADTQNNAIRKLTAPGAITGPTAPPSIQSVQSAGAFGAFPNTALGSWIEIFGSNLAADTRSWAGGDFSGINAPTSLDRTTVTIGGQAAFVSYISGGQVNAQVPSTVGTGPQQVTVTTAAGTSTAFTMEVDLTAPGILAPPSFNIGGKQYAAATFTDGVTFVLPVGAIAGVTSRPAKPGETIVLYGIGFGRVSNNLPAGQIVQQRGGPLPVQCGGPRDRTRRRRSRDVYSRECERHADALHRCGELTALRAGSAIHQRLEASGDSLQQGELALACAGLSTPRHQKTKGGLPALAQERPPGTFRPA